MRRTKGHGQAHDKKSGKREKVKKVLYDACCVRSLPKKVLLHVDIKWKLS